MSDEILSKFESLGLPLPIDLNDPKQVKALEEKLWRKGVQSAVCVFTPAAPFRL